MGHKNPEKFFNDPSAINPQSGQLLHPPPALTAPQVATGAEAAQLFSKVFGGNGGAGYPTVGDATFGAVAQANIGIVAAGPNRITSTRGITAYDGGTMMYFEPKNPGASITVSIDPTTRSIYVVENPERRA